MRITKIKFRLNDLIKTFIFPKDEVNSAIQSRVGREDFSAVVKEPGSPQRDQSTWIGAKMHSLYFYDGIHIIDR